MLKRNLLILFIMFCILCASSVCFANNTMDDMKNGVMSAKNTVVDGVENLAEDARDGIGEAEDSIEGALTMDNTNTYTSSRTSATMTDTTTRTSTLWIWAIVAIAAIGIIGMVWFYSTENRIH